MIENQDLPSSDNPQEVLEWLYTELKDVFSMNVILKSLQCIIRGGNDAVDSNIEDFQSKANPASADGNRVSAEEKGVRKQPAFQIEDAVMESEGESGDGS